jgi:hypothetical protein
MKLSMRRYPQPARAKGLIQRFLGHVLPEVTRPLRVLWNEMIGFLFVVIAVPFAWQAIKSFRKVEPGDNLSSAMVSAFFAIVMTFFGIYSFLRARKISRS